MADAHPLPGEPRSQIFLDFLGQSGGYFLISSAPPAGKTPEINRSRTVDAPGYFYFILSPNNRGEVFGKSAKNPRYGLAGQGGRARPILLQPRVPGSTLSGRKTPEMNVPVSRRADVSRYFILF